MEDFHGKDFKPSGKGKCPFSTVFKAAIAEREKKMKEEEEERRKREELSENFHVRIV